MASMYQCRNLAMAARSLCARHDMKTPTGVHKCQKRLTINVKETYHQCKRDLFARRFMKTPMYTSLALLLALAFLKESMNCARSCCGDQRRAVSAAERPHKRDASTASGVSRVHASRVHAARASLSPHGRLQLGELQGSVRAHGRRAHKHT
jgi:hypothetical protein